MYCITDMKHETWGVISRYCNNVMIVAYCIISQRDEWSTTLTEHWRDMGVTITHAIYA